MVGRMRTAGFDLGAGPVAADGVVRDGDRKPSGLYNEPEGE